MHVIRLRKPWTRTQEPGGSTSERVDVPDLDPVTVNDGDSTFFVYRRKFNCPTSLSATRVYLNISEWQGDLVGVKLNGDEVNQVVTSSGFREEITSLLRSHNELVVYLAAPPEQQPRLSGEVSLMIDDSPTT
jgi:hypothetical protein